MQDAEIRSAFFTRYSRKNVQEDIAETASVGIFDQKYGRSWVKRAIYEPNNNERRLQKLRKLMNFYYIKSGGKMDEEFWEDYSNGIKIDLEYWQNKKSSKVITFTRQKI